MDTKEVIRRTKETLDSIIKEVEEKHDSIKGEIEEGSFLGEFNVYFTDSEMPQLSRERRNPELNDIFKIMLSIHRSGYSDMGDTYTYRFHGQLLCGKITVVAHENAANQLAEELDEGTSRSYEPPGKEISISLYRELKSHEDLKQIVIYYLNQYIEIAKPIIRSNKTAPNPTGN